MYYVKDIFNIDFLEIKCSKYAYSSTEKRAVFPSHCKQADIERMNNAYTASVCRLFYNVKSLNILRWNYIDLNA